MLTAGGRSGGGGNEGVAEDGQERAARLRAAAVAVRRAAEHQRSASAGQRDVKEAPLLLTAPVGHRAAARQVAVRAAGHEDDIELQPLRLVDRQDWHALLGVRQQIDLRRQGGPLEGGPERRGRRFGGIVLGLEDADQLVERGAAGRLGGDALALAGLLEDPRTSSAGGRVVARSVRQPLSCRASTSNVGAALRDQRPPLSSAAPGTLDDPGQQVGGGGDVGGGAVGRAVGQAEGLGKRFERVRLPIDEPSGQLQGVGAGGSA